VSHPDPRTPPEPPRREDTTVEDLGLHEERPITAEFRDDEPFAGAESMFPEEDEP
jgi:hypothetical protein